MDRDAWVSGLKIDDEGIRAIMFGLASECHEFAASRGIPSKAIEDQLTLVLDVLSDLGRDLIDCRPVPAGGASCLAAMTIGLSPEGYRRVASAAKDRIARSVDLDGGLVVV